MLHESMAKERLQPKAFLPTKERRTEKANEKMNEMHDWAYEQNNKANEYFVNSNELSCNSYALSVRAKKENDWANEHLVNSDELSCNSYTLLVWVKKENNKAHEHLVNSDELSRNSYALSVRVKK